MEDYHCIICSKPVNEDGFFGSIKDMKVSLCRNHAEGCMQECESCAQAPVCKIRLRALEE